jgi:hypothetical protein
VTGGAGAERAAILTAKRLQQYAKSVVFLIHEVFAIPVTWISVFTAQAKMLGIDTIDWIPRHLADPTVIKRNYLAVVSGGRTGDGFDMQSFGAFCGVWDDIKRRALCRETLPAPGNAARATPAGLACEAEPTTGGGHG